MLVRPAGWVFGTWHATSVDTQNLSEECVLGKESTGNTALCRGWHGLYGGCTEIECSRNVRRLSDLAFTRDGTITDSVIPVETRVLQSVFAEDKRVYEMGRRGIGTLIAIGATVLSTDDGGHTWQKQSKATYAGFADIACRAALCLAAGQGGAILQLASGSAP